MKKTNIVFSNEATVPNQGPVTIKFHKYEKRLIRRNGYQSLKRTHFIEIQHGEKSRKRFLPEYKPI